MLKSTAFWALIGAVILGLLQLLPIPGVFLMMFGGGILTALLVHVFLIPCSSNPPSAARRAS